jgi:2-C-methyl-D-erythritol 2,4-cyclodiphosphate synthase
VGHGFDVHRLVPDRPLILGGIKIPYEYGLLGHSDADVLCHAICDALLGAAALGDLGTHFPDNDPYFKGISSLRLLSHVMDLLKRREALVSNVDATLVLEKPRVATYISGMQENIARVLNLEKEAVSVKATTTEGLGVTGRGEGVAAHAVVLIDAF